MGVNTNQIATYNDLWVKLGDSFNASYIPHNNKAVTYKELSAVPYSLYFSGGSSSVKCIKYSDLTFNTNSKYVNFKVSMYNSSDRAYWGCYNTNHSNTKTIYIKNYAGTNLKTITLSSTTSGTSGNLTIAHNSSGYKINYNIPIHFTDKIYTNAGTSHASITVQPYVRMHVYDDYGLTLYDHTGNASPYSISSIANGAKVTLGPWYLTSPDSTIKILPTSGNINIDIYCTSIVKVTGGYAEGGGGSGGSGTATAVSLIGEWD